MGLRFKNYVQRLYLTIQLDKDQVYLLFKTGKDFIHYPCKNFEMQELIERFIELGLTPEQAQNTVLTIGKWLEENYPVAGTLVSAWIKEHKNNLS